MTEITLSLRDALLVRQFIESHVDSSSDLVALDLIDQVLERQAPDQLHTAFRVRSEEGPEALGRYVDSLE